MSKTVISFIKTFPHISKSDASIAGGKGASLGEMTSAGIPVPPGFVVLSSAFENFLESADLNVEIDSILHTVNHKEMHTVEDASGKIKDLILKAKMPQDIKDEIKKEFKKLKSKFVAVRSSATAEDSSSAAWAGQLDSFLNTTEKTLLANVQKCWASLFTPRAIFYRFETNLRQGYGGQEGLHNSKISVAVVIQKMIESEVSGIAFSVHPVTQDRNQLIIEAGYSLGEAIVSGQITPDSYVIEKNPRRIIDKNVSLQERGIYRKLKEGGNEWQNIPQEKGEKQKLTDDQILKLSELILKIENHYGFPVDIEWAFENNKFYITQSRPITTLEGEKNINGGERKKFYFEKEVTRDLSLLAIEGLGPALTNLYKKLKGFDPNSPLMIFYVKDLLVEEWLNGNLVKELIDFIYLENQKNPKFLKDSIVNYKKHISFYKNRNILSLEDLKKYLSSLYSALESFVVFYFTAGDERTPKPLLRIAKKVRNIDSLGDITDKKIRDALKNIFPHTDGYEAVISSNDLSAVPSMGVLKERAKHFLFIPGKLLETISLQEFSDNNPSYHFNIEFPPQTSNILIGQIGNKGYVKGFVRIVKWKKQISKLQKREILVSTMTTPDFVPAMQKAAGIITDEGGITCHAAITSRELKKPCIIGTKFATKVLHDGDLVEVDADKGVVRILGRAK